MVSSIVCDDIGVNMNGSCNVSLKDTNETVENGSVSGGEMVKKLNLKNNVDSEIKNKSRRMGLIKHSLVVMERLIGRSLNLRAVLQPVYEKLLIISD